MGLRPASIMAVNIDPERVPGSLVFTRRRKFGAFRPADSLPPIITEHIQTDCVIVGRAHGAIPTIRSEFDTDQNKTDAEITSTFTTQVA